MNNYANDQTLLWLRYKEQAVPIAFPAVRQFVRKEIDELYRKTGAQRLGYVRFLKEASAGHENSLAWYSHAIRPGSAKGITFCLSNCNGVTAHALRDIVRHEFAHYLCRERFPNIRNAHGEEWKSMCKEVGCIPNSTAIVLPLS